MSFTTDIKIELCRVTPSAHCCVLAECLGMLLYAYQANREGIRLQSECNFFVSSGFWRSYGK